MNEESKNSKEAVIKASKYIETILINNYQQFLEMLRLDKKSYSDFIDMVNENGYIEYINSYINILNILSAKISDFASCKKIEEIVADAIGDKGLEIQTIAQNLNILKESLFEDEVSEVILFDIIQSMKEKKVSYYNSAYFINGLKNCSHLITEDLDFENGEIFLMKKPRI